MPTATAKLPNYVRGVSSEAAILGPEGTGRIESAVCLIQAGIRIRLDRIKATVVVTRPFVIELTPTGGGYMASSRISNTFELGSTLSEATLNYLEFLADELLWLQQNLEQLSPPLQEGFHLLQHYLRIE